MNRIDLHFKSGRNLIYQVFSGLLSLLDTRTIWGTPTPILSKTNYSHRSRARRCPARSRRIFSATANRVTHVRRAVNLRPSKEV